MSTVDWWNLHNQAGDLPRQVLGGTPVTITVNGLGGAEIGPVRSVRHRFLSKTDHFDIMTRRQADPGLRDDLARPAGETDDELDPAWCLGLRYWARTFSSLRQAAVGWTLSRCRSRPR